jgi:L-asparaginase II
MGEQTSDLNDTVADIHWRNDLDSPAVHCSVDWFTQNIHVAERSRSATDVQAVYANLLERQNEL